MGQTSIGEEPSRDRMVATLSHVIRQHFIMDESLEVTEKSHLIADLGLDSIDQIELIMLIEDSYGIEVPGEDECLFAATVGEIVDYVVTKRSRAS